MDMGAAIALIVIAAFLIFVIGCVVYRNLLGKIEVKFPDRLYKLGDDISGHVTLKSKSVLDVEAISIKVKCVKLLYKNQINSGSSRSTVYEEGIVFDEPFTIRKGRTRKFDFDLKLPDTHPQIGISRSVKSVDIPEFNEKMVGLMKAAQTNNYYDHRWSISVEAKTRTAVIYGGKAIQVEGYTFDDVLAAQKQVRKIIHEK